MGGCQVFFFGGGCQGGCERKRRIEVIVKIHKKIGREGSGQGRCERRIEVFFLMQKHGGSCRVVGSQGGCE